MATRCDIAFYLVTLLPIHEPKAVLIPRVRAVHPRSLLPSRCSVTMTIVAGALTQKRTLPTSSHISHTKLPHPIHSLPSTFRPHSGSYVQALCIPVTNTITCYSNISIQPSRRECTYTNETETQQNRRTHSMSNAHHHFDETSRSGKILKNDFPGFLHV